MVSTNTPLNGARHQNNTLIFQPNSAKHHNKLATTASASSFGQTTLFTRLVLVLFFLSISFLVRLNAQCTPACGTVFNVELDPTTNGVTPLAPQAFYTGSCGTVTISPSTVDCSNIGTLVTLTLTSNGTTQCVGNEIQLNVVDNVRPTLTCPPFMSIDCSASKLPANTGMPTATDNCSASSSIVINQVMPDVIASSSIVGVCDTIKRTWTAVDSSGNTSTCVQEIEVTDSNPPTLVFASGSAPNDTTVNCIGALPATVTFSGMDNCGFTTSVADTPTGKGTDPNMCNFYNYTVNRVYEVKDGCNNIAQHTQVITIADTVAPIVPSQGAIMTASPPPGSCQAVVSLSTTVSDNCASATNIQGFYIVMLQSTGDTITNGGGLDASGTYDVGVYDIEFTAIDPCGNFSKEVYVLDVADGSNPTASCKALVNLTVDSQTGMSTITGLSLDDNSTDNCTPNNMLTFSVARVDDGTDIVSCADIGSTITAILTVTDANGNSNTCTSDVAPTASNPTAICTNISVDLDAAGNYDLNAPANAADLALLTSQFVDMCNSPLSFTFSTTMFGCDDLGANLVTVTGINSVGMMSACTATVIVNDVTPPIVSCRATYDAYLDENGQISLDPQWLLSGDYEMYMTGGDDNNFITPFGITEYKLTSPNGVTFSFDWDYETEDSRGAIEDYFSYNTPSTGWVDLAISSSVAPVSGTDTVTLAPGEQLKIWLRSSDNTGGRASARLYNFNGISPVSATPLADFGDLYMGNWQKVFVRSDGDAFISGGDIQTIDCTEPADLNFSISPSIFTCDSLTNSPHVATLTVTDSNGNSSMCTSSVNVIDDRAPEFECTDFAAQIDQSGNVVVEPGWFLDGPKSFYLESSGNGSHPMQGTVDYTVRVKTSGILTFNWDFESADTTLLGERFGVVVNGNFLPLNVAASQSNVSQSIPVNVGDVFGFRIESNNNTFNSHASIRPANFTLTNDYDPTLWKRTISNNDGLAFIHGSVSDNCRAIGDLNMTIDGNSILSYDCSSMSPDTFVVKVTDISGNNKTCDAIVTIVDNEPPIAVCPSSYSVTIGSNGEVDLSILPATENIVMNSFDNCEVDTVIVSPMKLTCDDVGANVITYMVVDIFGNSASCTNTVTAQEGTAPQITCPAAIVVQCENLPADTMAMASGMATASDNCSATSVSYSDVVTGMVPPLVLPDCKTIDRTWTAVDGSGNSSTCTQQITIEDNEAPVMMSPANFNSAITAQCGVIFNPPNVTATDNCSGMMQDMNEVDSRFVYDMNGMVVDTVAGSEVGTVGHYNYTLTRTWSAVDACGNTSSLSQTVTVSDTNKPFITYPNSLIRNTDPGSCDATINGLSLKSTDIRDCADFQYLTITNDSPYATSGGGDASGTYPLGITTVRFTVTDPTGNFRIHSVSIEVKDVETPNMNCEDDFSIVLTSAGTASISVLNIDEGSNDACGLNSLSINPTTFDCTDVGLQTVTLTGIDNNGNIGICTTTVEVQTNATSSVTISCPAAATVACPTAPNPSVTGTALFTTACGSGNVSFNDNVSPAPSCGMIVRTWTATDGTTSQSCTQTITMVDNNAPRIVSMVPTYPIQRCNVPAIDQLTYSDNCKGNFTVTPVDDTLTTGGFAYDTDPMMCRHYSFNVRRTWTAMDDCGNAASPVISTIRIRDREAPVITIANPLVVATDNNSCNATVNIDLKDFVDDCADDANLGFTLDGIAGNSVISGTYALGTHTFNLEVVDPCGNTTGIVPVNIQVEDQQTPTAVCIQNVVIVLDNTGNATINPADVDAGSTDNCTSVPNLMMSVSPASFTTADIGAVQVTLTVEDQAGLTNTCVASGTVVGGVAFDADEVSIAESGTGTLPVNTINFQNITSFSFDVTVTDTTVATVSNLINVNAALTAGGTFTPMATTNGYSITWTATSMSSPVSLTDGATLFELDLAAVGMAGDMSNVDVSNDAVSLLIGGASTSSASVSIDGSVTIFNPTTVHTFDVTAKTEEGLAVANATVSQSGGTTSSSMTDATGTASFTESSGMTATFAPSKLTGWKEGVTTNDAFLVLSHPNPTSTFGSGYKNIAADADGNDIITGNDAILIFQLAVDPAFTAIPGNTSWRFIHETPNLSTVSNPWGMFSESYTTTVSADETVNFIGVKTGDVDATANPALRGGTFEFIAENQFIDESNTRVEIPFKAKDFKAVNGYQFTIDFETKLLEYVDVIPGTLPNLTSFNFKDAKVEDGYLTTGWINMEALDLNDNDVVFTLVFESQSSGFELKDAVSVSDNLIPMEVIENGGDLKNQIDLVFESSTSSTNNTFDTNLELRQNVPNPFNNETVVGFALPGSTDMKLTFMDASGKLLHSVDGNYPQGYHEVTISKSVLPTTGIVFYQLQTEFGNKVRKMIILE